MFILSNKNITVETLSTCQELRLLPISLLESDLPRLYHALQRYDFEGHQATVVPARPHSSAEARARCALLPCHFQHCLQSQAPTRIRSELLKELLSHNSLIRHHVHCESDLWRFPVVHLLSCKTRGHTIIRRYSSFWKVATLTTSPVCHPSGGSSSDLFI